MTLQITHYAPDSSMGDISETEASNYREWAELELKKEFPYYDITVLNQESFVRCTVHGTNDEELIDNIDYFVYALWDEWCGSDLHHQDDF